MSFDLQALEGRTWTWRHEGGDTFRGGFVRVRGGLLEWSHVSPAEGGLQLALLRQTPEAFLAAGPPDLGEDTPDAYTVEAISEELLRTRREPAGGQAR